MKRITLLFMAVCMMAQLHAQTFREKISLSTYLTASPVFDRRSPLSLSTYLTASPVFDRRPLSTYLTASPVFDRRPPLSDSDICPLSLLVSAEYRLHPRFTAGLGSGVSKYDHLMLPVFATLHWQVTKPRRFTPFLACNIGHAFAPKKHVSGGFYLTPSVGLSYKLKGRQSLSLSIGYELQEYSQLVTYESTIYLTASPVFDRHFSNHALTASIGFTF